MQPIYLNIGPNWPNWQCCLAGSSKRAPRILIFSIAMDADYSFYVKNIETHGLAFLPLNISAVGRVAKVLLSNLYIVAGTKKKIKTCFQLYKKIGISKN